MEWLVAKNKSNILIERWRREYNRVRSHSSLDYRSPAPEVLR
ncbi:integrase core domain-containing protein [Chloroflexota bacterium]